MQTLIGKASILLEALPYIKNFYGETFVIKYGGSAFTDENLRALFAKDIVLLKYIGINPIIVHGGGPQISSFLKKLNISTEFVGGLRVTTKEVMQIVEMVLCGFVNKDIVSLINSHGGNAVGISGKDANLLFVKKVSTEKYLKNLGMKENIGKDVGYVGEIVKVRPEILKKLIEDKFIPVIAPIGVGIDYQEETKLATYNINADLAAGEIAGSLPSRKLILLTDVEGLKVEIDKLKDILNVFKYYRILKEDEIINIKDNSKVLLKFKKLDKNFYLISKFSLKFLNLFIQKGVIKGGMIPKLLSCKTALEKGVKKAHIINGKVPHSILLEIFTKEGIGTEIVL